MISKKKRTAYFMMHANLTRTDNAIIKLSIRCGLPKVNRERNVIKALMLIMEV